MNTILTQKFYYVNILKQRFFSLTERVKGDYKNLFSLEIKLNYKCYMTLFDPRKSKSEYIYSDYSEIKTFMDRNHRIINIAFKNI